MTHLALVGLLAGSLALTPPDGPGDDKKKSTEDKTTTESVETPGVFHADKAERDAELRSPTVYTYAQGRPVAEAPIKLWAQYAYGTADSYWDVTGDTQDIGVGGEGPGGIQLQPSGGEVVSQRVQVGAQVNFISFSRFSLGAGAILNVAKNNFNLDGTAGTAGIGDLESDFGLQGLKVFGAARGRVVGVHGGYQFDFGDEQTFAAGVPQDLANSDGRDAIFFGADFDYPSERVRVFGGVDYVMVQGLDSDETTTAGEDDQDWMNYVAGVGLKFGFVEVGGAFQIQTRHGGPTLESIGTEDGIGSHAGTVVPYIRLSPPSIPASLYLKGATPDEYFEYGVGIGGANSVKPRLGFTAGLSIGFN